GPRARRSLVVAASVGWRTTRRVRRPPRQALVAIGALEMSRSLVVLARSGQEVQTAALSAAENAITVHAHSSSHAQPPTLPSSRSAHPRCRVEKPPSSLRSGRRHWTRLGP